MTRGINIKFNYENSTAKNQMTTTIRKLQLTAQTSKLNRNLICNLFGCIYYFGGGEEYQLGKYMEFNAKNIVTISALAITKKGNS